MSRDADPETIATLVASSDRPLLLGLDVDGVLAPLVDHAADSRLTRGVYDAISAIAELSDVTVAVISGRSLDGLDQFGFGTDVTVIGSHGMEMRDQAMEPLDDVERRRLSEIDALMADAVTAAGEGAWIERKPASLVLHVRTAAVDQGSAALAQLQRDAASIEGVTAKAGSNVVELFARHADKGSALVDLASRLGAATTVFVGDDLTDEEAFARLSPTDIAIKVGDADTIAPYRLADPDAVLAFLRAIPAHR